MQKTSHRLFLHTVAGGWSTAVVILPVLDKAIFKGSDRAYVGTASNAVVRGSATRVRHQGDPTEGPKHDQQHRDGNPRQPIGCRHDAGAHIFLVAHGAERNDGRCAR